MPAAAAAAIDASGSRLRQFLDASLMAQGMWPTQPLGATMAGSATVTPGKTVLVPHNDLSKDDASVYGAMRDRLLRRSLRAEKGAAPLRTNVGGSFPEAAGRGSSSNAAGGQGPHGGDGGSEGWCTTRLATTTTNNVATGARLTAASYSAPQVRRTLGLDGELQAPAPLSSSPRTATTTAGPVVEGATHYHAQHDHDGDYARAPTWKHCIAEVRRLERECLALQEQAERDRIHGAADHRIELWAQQMRLQAKLKQRSSALRPSQIFLESLREKDAAEIAALRRQVSVLSRGVGVSAASGQPATMGEGTHEPDIHKISATTVDERREWNELYRNLQAALAKQHRQMAEKDATIAQLQAEVQQLRNQSRLALASSLVTPPK